MLSAKFLEVNIPFFSFNAAGIYIDWAYSYLFIFFFLFSSLFLLRHISHGNWVILLVKRILVVSYKRTCNNIVKRVFLFRIFMVNSQPRTGGLYKLFFLFTLLSGFRLSIMLFVKIINQYLFFFFWNNLTLLQLCIICNVHRVQLSTVEEKTRANFQWARERKS